MIYRESRGVDRLKIRLTASERSLLSFLKKREITVIRRAIEKKHRRIIELQGKKSFMECLVSSIDSMANPYPAKR